MIRFRHTLIAAIAAATLTTPAAAQQQPGQGAPPPPGSKDSAAETTYSREENASYNRVVGRVGSNPVEREKAQSAAKLKPVPATPADIVAGAAVRDAKGVALGTIESIDGDSAILVFSTGKIRFPLIGFGKDRQGLLINLSTADFRALVEKAKSSS